MKRSDSINVTLDSILEKYKDIASNYDFIADYFRTLSPFKLFSNYDGTSEFRSDVIYLFEDMSKEDYNKLSRLVMKYYIWK